MHWKAISPDIEVRANSILNVWESFGALQTVGMRYLQAHVPALNLTKTTASVAIQSLDWYPASNFLSAIHAMQAEIGLNATFELGMRISKRARFPPVQGIHEAMRMIDVAYHMNHRCNGVEMFDPITQTMQEGIGHYGCRYVAGEQRIVSVCDNPYPCQMDLGLITAMARMFEKQAYVTHDDDAPCRQQGGASCTFTIVW